MNTEVRQINIKGIYSPLSSKDIKYINLIGVELEGGWEEGGPDNIHEDVSVQIDGKTFRTEMNKANEDLAYYFNITHNCHRCSHHAILCDINCQAHCDNDCIIHCGCTDNGDNYPIELLRGAKHNAKRIDTYIGECISPPCTIEKIRSFLAANTPDKVSETCGLHVHVSMKKSIDYIRLTELAFYDYFINWFKTWGEEMDFPPKHKFWERLEGRNRFCRKEFNPKAQLAMLEKGVNNETRRTHLNYCYNIANDDGSKRKTVECRLFPGFNDASVIMAAVESLVRCIETYLSKSDYKTSAIEFELCVKDGEIVSV